MKKQALDSDQLYTPCNTEHFHFENTDELDDVDVFIGQERAVDSIEFGMRVGQCGYNIFALAPSGTGKLTTIQQLVHKESSQHPAPPDWCYVNNFIEHAKPRALEFSPGKGKEFQNDMLQLVDELSVAIPAAFDGDEYRAKSEEIEEEYRQREIEEISQLREEAINARIILTETPTGYAFSPLDDKKDPITPEEFNKLDKAEQKKYQNSILELQQHLQKLLNKFPAWRKEARRKQQQLNRTTVSLAVNHTIDELKHKYSDHNMVTSYLEDVDADILLHVRDFIPHREQMSPFMESVQDANPFKRYQVNLIISNDDSQFAPVILENHPNYANLLGRIDHQAYMGTLVTDFTMIKPGALHRANGGYLILDARKLLMQPYAWECLKRSLQFGEIRIESLERSLSLVSTSSLEPEPIPLDLKVIIYGDRIIYYLLNQYDPEFQDLFKIAADFDDSVGREGTELEYACLLATLAKKEKLLPVSRHAVARIIEQSSRLSGDAEKLSTHLRSINDLLTESDYWARFHGHDVIANSDVQQAIEHKVHRLDRIREKVYENIHRGTVMIDLQNKVIGQINGLSVIQLGEFMFGQPSRITATTRLGNGKVIDIEKETELGGAIHSKGVLILSSFIAARYARKTPFSMAASLVFEQSYGYVEGDSASLAELCVILSSLAEIPLRQDLAITGSVNQLGRVQPIGGVNEKIEGFFDICKAQGLTGKQGVIIPASNIKYLMLRWDVVHAAKAGQFAIYAVETVDEALQYLSDMDAGTCNDKGDFPEHSFNGKVQQQLLTFNTIQQQIRATENTHDAGK
ncbi:ATP-dependent protease [Methyloprofundus sedimenti]|uniref:endopeptidase La n=1 Tax=Methyloprofundus sedimenti TaxID=1420851 RepID=A0A1V8M9H2_9GAMM|nr:ATP-binding protein [Methyloprofundus sedimenti]OQK18251.1 ATP-dependent protease [Methyloprofundus sedimenti]